MEIRLPSILLFLALSCCQVFAQTQVRGNVKDASDGTAVAGAIVKLEDKEGKTLSFAISNNAGTFNISSEKTADGLRVSLLGYYDTLLQQPFPLSLEVALKQKPVKIEASTVVAHKVISAGDTISYNVRALTNPQDRVLSDLLKRIPGLDVTSSGAVSYNGTSINRFYVNGKDLLQNDYRQVAKGLPVDDVKTVEVLTNHQPLKILQGLKESDRAAVNIVLDDDAAARLLGTLNAGAGGKAEQPYPVGLASADLFLLKDKMSSVNNLDARWESVSRDQADNFDLIMNYRHETLRYMASFPGVSVPFPGLSAESRRAFCASSVDRFPLGNGGLVGGSFKVATSRTAVSQERLSAYKDETAGKDIRIASQRTVSPVEMQGSLIYSKNTSGFYVDGRLMLNKETNDGYSETSGDMSGMQYVRRGRLEVENDATVGFRTGGSAVTINSYTQFSSADEDMQLEDYGTRQTVGSSLFKQYLSVSGIKKNAGMWKFSLRPSATFAAFGRNSQLEGLPEDVAAGQREGSDKSMSAEAGISGGVEYGAAPFTTELDGTLAYSTVWWNADIYRKALADVSLSMKYVSSRWELRSSLSAGSNSPDLQSIGTAVINTSYNYLWRGVDAPAYSPSQSASLSVLYREPVSGWHVRANAGLSHGRDFLSARNIYGTYILSYRSGNSVDTRSVNSGFQFEKGLFSINGKLKMDMNAVWSESSFQQNGKVVSYRTALYMPNLDLSITPLRWWSTSLNASSNLSLLTQEGYSMDGRSLSASVDWKNTFIPSQTFFITLAADACYNSAMDMWVFIPSASAELKVGKQLRFSLTAENLLNVREIRYSSISPLLEETVSYRVRPLSVIATVRWQL